MVAYLLSAELLQTTGELVSHWHQRIGTKNSSDQNWQLAGDAINQLQRLNVCIERNQVEL